MDIFKLQESLKGLFKDEYSELAISRRRQIAMQISRYGDRYGLDGIAVCGNLYKICKFDNIPLVDAVSSKLQNALSITAQKKINVSIREEKTAPPFKAITSKPCRPCPERDSIIKAITEYFITFANSSGVIASRYNPCSPCHSFTPLDIASYIIFIVSCENPTIQKRLGSSVLDALYKLKRYRGNYYSKYNLDTLLAESAYISSFDNAFLKMALIKLEQALPKQNAIIKKIHSGMDIEMFFCEREGVFSYGFFTDKQALDKGRYTGLLSGGALLHALTGIDANNMTSRAFKREDLLPLSCFISARFMLLNRFDYYDNIDNLHKYGFMKDNTVTTFENAIILANLYPDKFISYELPKIFCFKYRELAQKTHMPPREYKRCGDFELWKMHTIAISGAFRIISPYELAHMSFDGMQMSDNLHENAYFFGENQAIFIKEFSGKRATIIIDLLPVLKFTVITKNIDIICLHYSNNCADFKTSAKSQPFNDLDYLTRTFQSGEVFKNNQRVLSEKFELTYTFKPKNSQLRSSRDSFSLLSHIYSRLDKGSELAIKLEISDQERLDTILNTLQYVEELGYKILALSKTKNKNFLKLSSTLSYDNDCQISDNVLTVNDKLLTANFYRENSKVQAKEHITLRSGKSQCLFSNQYTLNFTKIDAIAHTFTLLPVGGARHTEYYFSGVKAEISVDGKCFSPIYLPSPCHGKYSFKNDVKSSTYSIKTDLFEAYFKIGVQGISFGVINTGAFPKKYCIKLTFQEQLQRVFNAAVKEKYRTLKCGEVLRLELPLDKSPSPLPKLLFKSNDNALLSGVFNRCYENFVLTGCGSSLNLTSLLHALPMTIVAGAELARYLVSKFECQRLDGTFSAGEKIGFLLCGLAAMHIAAHGDLKFLDIKVKYCDSPVQDELRFHILKAINIPPKGRTSQIVKHAALYRLMQIDGLITNKIQLLKQIQGSEDSAKNSTFMQNFLCLFLLNKGKLSPFILHPKKNIFTLIAFSLLGETEHFIKNLEKVKFNNSSLLLYHFLSHILGVQHVSGFLTFNPHHSGIFLGAKLNFENTCIQFAEGDENCTYMNGIKVKCDSFSAQTQKKCVFKIISKQKDCVISDNVIK